MNVRAAAIFCVLLLNCVGLRAAGSYYDEKPEIPSTPYSDALSRIKNMPLGAGFRASIGGSTQQRFQTVDNRRDYNYGLNDQDTSLLSRERLNLDIFRDDRLFRCFFEAQDAHEFWKDSLPNSRSNPNENALDIYQCFVEFNLLWDIADMPALKLKVGRQEIKYGAEYLLGDRDWFNRGQSFDAARLTWRPEAFEIDFLVASPVEVDNNNLDHEGDPVFGGAILKAVGLPDGHLIESAVFYRANERGDFIGEDGSSGAEHIWYFNARAQGRFAKRWDYAFEGTVDVGERGGDQLRAYRFDGGVGYTIPFWNWRSVRLGAHYTIASGDNNPTDGKIETFDSLYPDPFIFHGRTFAVAGTNIKDITGAADIKLWRGGVIEMRYHNLSLQQSRDAVYDAASFRPSRRDPTGQAGKFLGHEMDFQVTHTFHENLSVSGGAFFFEPGEVYRKTGNRGDDLTRNFFVMVRVGF